MAHKGGVGTSTNGRDSNSKRLGIKLSSGQRAQPGSIVVRQRGTNFLPGPNVRRGRDDTLFALAAGLVQFRTFTKKTFSGSHRLVKLVSVIPQPAKA